MLVAPMRTLRGAVLCLMAMLPVALSAQTTATTASSGTAMTLTLDQAIDLAVKNNPQLRIARLEMDRAEYQVNEAIGTALPTVSASGTYSRALKKQVFFLPDFVNPGSGIVTPIEIGSDHSLQFGLTATQILFNNAVFTGVGTARIYRQASQDLYRDAYGKTVSGVRQAWYGVLFVRDVFEMTKASMRNAEDNFHSVKVMQEQGIVSEYDMIRAEVQVENIRPMVLEAERNMVMALNGLRIAMGVRHDQEIDVIGKLEQMVVDADLLERAEALASENNAQLRALGHQVEVNKALIAINRSEHLPTLVAFGNYMWQDQKNDFNKFAFNSLIGSSSVGLQLSLTLFNGLQTTNRVNQAQVDYLKVQETKKSAEDGILTSVQNARLRIIEASKRIETQGRTVEQAEKGYHIATTRYAAGAGTQLEINDADLALMRARVNRVQAVYDYNVAASELQALLGVEGPTDIR